MPLIPAFEIGVWNAWILILAYLLLALVPFLVLRVINKDVVKRSPTNTVPYNKTEERINIFTTLAFVLLIIYSVFLPLQLGTAWFYIGLLICLLALIMSVIVFINWVTTPLDKPVTKGLYRYSRHPLYLIQTLIFIGTGIASASWIFLLFSVILTVLSFLLIAPEEHSCLEKFGDAYRDYMNRTPRWLGLPKAG